MNEKIKIGVSIDPECEQPQVLIKTAEKTELVENIIKAIEQCAQGSAQRLMVYDSDRIVFLDQRDIVRVYIENRMLAVCTATDKYLSRMTLKDFEEMLEGDYFARISRFEIVNLNKAAGFDLSVAGTVGITFDDGSETWVARRYVRAISDKISSVQGGEAYE